MLTPDQVRLRLRRVKEINHGNMATPGYTDLALDELSEILAEVLPDLVASARQPERPESQLREPPKMYRPRPGEDLANAIRGVTRSIEEAMAWMQEAMEQ